MPPRAESEKRKARFLADKDQTSTEPEPSMRLAMG